MARKNDPVEALAKVLEDARRQWMDDPTAEFRIGDTLCRFQARAAIAHLSKPQKPLTILERVAAINRAAKAKPKRGAKRGK